MIFSHRQLEGIAKKLGISERAVERLLGNTTAELRRSIDFATVDITALPPQQVERFQLGVRLQGDTPLRWSEMLAAECVRTLEEYRRLCPHCFSWVSSAAFDGRKLPENVTRATVLHASRTASRLRAKLLRKFQQQLL